VLLVFTYENCPLCKEKKEELRESGVDFREYIVQSDGMVIVPEGGVQEDLYSAWAKAKQTDVDTDAYPWTYDTETQIAETVAGGVSCKLTKPSCGDTE